MVRMVMERPDAVRLLGEVFRRYGFDGASIARITEQTKMGKGSLYHFFPGGKEEMAAAVLAEIRAWFEAQVFAPLESLPPAEALEAMFAAVEAYFRSGRRICLVGAFALEETRDRFAAEVGGYFSRWLEALSSALRRGGVPAAEADLLARRMVSGIQGGIVLARALDSEGPFAEALEDLRRIGREALER